MTRRELICALEAAGIEDAESDACWLFSHFSGLSPAEMLANPDLSLDSEAFRAAVERRLSREPLAYIVGEADFMTERYRVTPDCLIPRFDTELLVEEAVLHLPKGALFADLCTGSGCIAVSTLVRRCDATAVGYDISAPAVALARENAERNGVSERFSVVEADLLKAPLPEDRFDAILSNPPYINTAVIETLSPEVQREPLLALDGGEDGTRFYCHFLSRLSPALKKSGFFLFEIGYDQKDKLLSLADTYGFTAEIKKDYGGNPRLAILYRK